MLTFDDAYQALTTESLTTQEKDALDDRGFLVVPDLIDDAWRIELIDAFDRILDAEGDEASRVPGTHYQPEPGAPRIAFCVNRGEVFRRAYRNGKVLAAARHVIGRPFKLHGYNARDVRAGQGHQKLHPDSRRESSDEQYHLINTLWLLDDFTVNNGATRVVPGSHRIAGPIEEHVTDVQAPHPDQVILTAPRGTVVIFNGHLWHGGTRNDAGTRRRVLHVSYVARDKPQQVDHRNAVLPETRAELSTAECCLLDI